MTRNYYNPLSSVGDKTSAHHAAEMQRELRGIKIGSIPVRDKLAERNAGSVGSIWRASDVTFTGPFVVIDPTVEFWIARPDWTAERNVGGFTIGSTGGILPPKPGWYSFFTSAHIESSGESLDEGSQFSVQAGSPNLQAVNSSTIVDGTTFRIYPDVSVAGIDFFASHDALVPTVLIGAQAGLSLGDMPDLDHLYAALLRG